MSWKTCKFKTPLKMRFDRALFVKIIQDFFSEVLGTAILVFVGCMGCIKGFDEVSDRTGLSLSFSLAVFLAIQVSSQNSGGHVNPAVTLLSFFFQKIKWYMGLVYFFGQIVGSLAGFGLLMAITPHDLFTKGYVDYGMCTTVPNPNLNYAEAFFAEFIFTTILLLLICSGWDSRNTLFDSFYLKIGFGVFSLVYSGLPYTGCSMNPARSFGPAVWNNSWSKHWIYWTGPLLASGFTGVIYTQLLNPKWREAKRKTTDDKVKEEANAD